MSKSPKNDNRPAPKNDNRATAKRPHPWADVDGIDYGPAVAALGDLVTWAFDLAAVDVYDWPEGRRRVGNTRKYVHARLRGKRPHVPVDDVLFTAGLLARIFEADIGLGMSEMVAVLDRIGLPTEVVPMMPRAQPHSRIPARVLELGRNALRGIEPELDPDPEPCEGCRHCARYRNAA